MAGDASDCIFLADGIHPKWAVFASAIQDPETEEEKHHAARQEACRKDAERLFGALQGAWQIIDRPCNYWRREALISIVKRVCILRNMTVEARRALRLPGGGGAGGAGACDLGGGIDQQSQSERAAAEDPPAASLAGLMAGIEGMTSASEHWELKRYLVSHNWARR